MSEGRPRLLHWTRHAFRLPDGLTTDAELAESLAELEHFHAYLADRMDAALADPGEDVVGDLARAVAARERGGEGLEAWEARAILFQLVVGGLETSVGLLGTPVFHAAQQPELWLRMQSEPDCIPAFIEEALRLDGSGFGSNRRVTRDTQLAGVPLPKGSSVVLLWGSANRDAAQFSDPECFVIDRPNAVSHFGFGHGKHLCLGRALARVEIREVLLALLARYDRIVGSTGPSRP